MIYRAAIALSLSFAGPTLAEEFTLQSPIDCDLNGACYIQQYMDRDPSAGVSDFRCSSHSYDGHKGTDFALRTHADIEKGVAVVAAAPGRVQGIRDGMADLEYSAAIAEQVKNRECGNGVQIDHGNGWVTQYCHLRQGSVSVKSGQTVAAGDPLGEVGMSGQAAFPHVHLSVRKDGEPIDPFDPKDTLTCNAEPEKTLWEDPPVFQPGGLISIGFADGIPTYEAIKSGTAAMADIAPDAPAFVIYGFAFGVTSGDVLRLSIMGPNGKIIENDVTMEKTQARAFRAIGKKRRSDHWPAGSYKGEVTLLRGDEIIDQQEIEISLE